MAASFPSSTKSFSTKVDGPGNTIFASHINEAQDEIVAIENYLRTGAVAFGSTVTAASQPRALVYHNATQSIATGSSLTALSFNSETYDVGAMHDTVANNSRLTVPAGGDGLYLVVAGAFFASNATGVRSIAIRKGGTTVVGGANCVGTSAVDSVLQTSALVALVAGDYVEACVNQTSGGNLNVGDTTGTYHWFAIAKLW